MYAFLTGPMFYLSITVFILGMLGRTVLYIRGLDWKLDRVAYRVYPKAGINGALRSIICWLIPFGTRSWRVQPFMTILFFVFHIGVVSVPLFLPAHNLILKSKIGMSLFSLNPVAADVLTWGVLISAVFIIVRRIALAEVRMLTTAHDYLILAISVVPFITGMICRYSAGDYSFWMIFHILSSELLLIAAPFTKLSHMVLYFMSRAQIGMDFGIKRGGMKGKGMAW